MATTTTVRIAALLLAAVLVSAALPVSAVLPAQAALPAPAEPPIAASAPAPEASPGDVVRGKQVYARACVVCHGAAGSGGLGPSLNKAATRLSPEQITQQITQPKASMPQLYPNAISDAELRDVVSYVMTL
jgi:mono/diheme cytochrome c family protein